MVFVNAHWYLWHSLDLVYGKMLGKEVACIHIADGYHSFAARHSVSFGHSSLSYRDIKDQNPVIKKQFCSRTIRVLKHAFQANVQFRHVA